MLRKGFYFKKKSERIDNLLNCISEIFPETADIFVGVNTGIFYFVIEYVNLRFNFAVLLTDLVSVRNYFCYKVEQIGIITVDKLESGTLNNLIKLLEDVIKEYNEENL